MGIQKRVKFTITFEVDLDLVPGVFHNASDWVNMVQRDFLRQTHYNACTSIVRAPVEVQSFDNTSTDDLIEAIIQASKPQ